jgi:hypothetical protein
MYRTLLNFSIQNRDKGKLFISAIEEKDMNLQFGMLQGCGAQDAVGNHEFQYEDYTVTWGGGAEGGGGTPN